MPRPFTRAQAAENAAFLRALRRTGNAREAARQLGAHRAKFTRRRVTHPAFAAEWDAALALADAALRTRTPASPRPQDPRIIRMASGRHQLRRPVAGQLTPDHRQRFLLALSATANVRLSAAAAGLSHSAFYQLRARDPGFAREMRAALAEGYERIEMALHEGFLPSAHKDDSWRDNDPPPIPPMSVSQALQLLYLHQKEARLLSEPAHIKRRRGESPEARSFRLAAMYEEGRRRDREAFAVAEAARADRGEPCMADMLTANLPDLAQVTGWSKADPARTPHRPDVALFGGWRIEDMAASARVPDKRRR